MVSVVRIGPSRLRGFRFGSGSRAPLAYPQGRASGVLLGVIAAFALVAGQLLRLGAEAPDGVESSVSAPLATGLARPDLVDRHGRLLANDVEMQSLYADPLLVIDRDEVAEKLRRVLPDIDAAAIRAVLSDRTRRFVWLRRGLSPALAQRIHDLGLPGLAFRAELRRAYPGGALAGHVLGGVDIDNAAIGGIERYLDRNGLVDPVHAALPTERRPLQLSLDVGVQHAVEAELADGMRLYGAKAAAGVVLDVTTGEVLAAASLPAADPGRPHEALAPDRRDRLMAGTFELGSVMKLFTVAQAIDGGMFHPATIVDVTTPLQAGRFAIQDLHPPGRPLSVAEVLLKSSNVGAAMLALEAGPERQRAFLERAGLMGRLATEAGGLAEPQTPARWDRAETITVSYGHGIALSPLQFATAAAALVNGGRRITPTFLKRSPSKVTEADGVPVISADSSRQLRIMMRRNVAEAGGTGRRADAPGYRVGGKTGTAEIAIDGRYDKDAVISSFLGAFPMDNPRYLTFLLLFEPQRTDASAGEITAGHTAAPLTRRLVERIAPLLAVLPERDPPAP